LSLAAVLALSVALTLLVTQGDRHLPGAQTAKVQQPTPNAATPRPPAASQNMPPSAAPPTLERSEKFGSLSTEEAPTKKEQRPQAKLKKDAAALRAPATGMQGYAEPERPQQQETRNRAQPFPAAPASPAPAALPENKPAPELGRLNADAGAARKSAPRDEIASESSGLRRKAEGEVHELTQARKPMPGAMQLRAEHDSALQEERPDEKRSAPSAASAPVSSAGALAAPWEANPSEWLRHIDTLIKDNRIEDARASFKAFRERYPSHPLPPDFPLREP
jgi:hypothetical protein